MTPEVDPSHDPLLRSWVESANAGSPFPIQNLPFAVFQARSGSEPLRICAGIGDQVLDLDGASDAGLLAGTGAAAEACRRNSLNQLMALGRPAWRSVRRVVSSLLATQAETSTRQAAARHLVPLADVEFALPAEIGDYSDFYASIAHATNVGRLFRPDNPLLPNYKWVPIGYHGRSSSVEVSGAPIYRPNGQTMATGRQSPMFGPCAQLDFEAELGFFIGPGNARGEPIPIGLAGDQVFGVCLLNDWSARDVQSWEYQPLGPFLAKSFATTISPWVVTMEALAPFRTPAPTRPPDDPQPLPYLRNGVDQASGGLDITIDAMLQTTAMREHGHPPQRLSKVRARDLYWTVAQLVAHHASNGCDLRPGDLLGSGTISNTELGAMGSLLELTERGLKPLALSNGETRAFLEDADELVLRGSCEREGFVSIGFGECRGRILPAPPASVGG